MLDERGEPGRAGAFDDRLLDLGRERDRGFDVLFGDDEQIVDECADDLAGEHAHGRDRDAFGDRRPRSRLGSAAERVHHARVALDLRADDVDLGLQRLGRDRDAGDEAAAPDRHDDRVDIGNGVEDLEPDGALPRDDRGVVERGHERRAGVGRHARAPSVSAPAKSAPASTTSAPWTSVRVIFVNGVSAGITIVAGIPSRWAW